MKKDHFIISGVVLGLLAYAVAPLIVFAVLVYVAFHFITKFCSMTYIDLGLESYLSVFLGIFQQLSQNFRDACALLGFVQKDWHDKV